MSCEIFPLYQSAIKCKYADFYDYLVQSYRHPDLVKTIFIVYIMCFIALGRQNQLKTPRVQSRAILLLNSCLHLQACVLLNAQSYRIVCHYQAVDYVLP